MLPVLGPPSIVCEDEGVVPVARSKRSRLGLAEAMLRSSRCRVGADTWHYESEAVVVYAGPNPLFRRDLCCVTV